MFRFAADRMHLEAGAAEDIQRQRPHAPGRTGHAQRAELRRLAVVEQAVQRQRGSESRGAEDHRFAQAQAVRERNRPFGLDARELGVAAVTGLAQPAARDQHRIAFPEGLVRR